MWITEAVQYGINKGISLIGLEWATFVKFLGGLCAFFVWFWGFFVGLLFFFPLRRESRSCIDIHNGTVH